MSKNRSLEEIRGKNYHLVVEANDTKGNMDLPKHFVEKFLKWFVQFHEGTRYFFILHDKDRNELKELERPHYHIIVAMPCRMVASKLLKDTSHYLMIDNNRIGIEKVSNLTSMLQYLVHMNEDYSKFRYDTNEVITNSSDFFKDSLKDKENECTVTYLIATVNSCSSISEVYTILGTRLSMKYHWLIFNLWKEKKGQL